MKNRDTKELQVVNMWKRFCEEGTFDACVEGNDHNNKAPLIGLMGGAGYVLTLIIFVAGHIAVTQQTQLKVLLTWLLVDAAFQIIRYGIMRRSDSDRTDFDRSEESDTSVISKITEIIPFHRDVA
ncbi:MAG: hypothetical protein IJ079_03015 [Lachnospiraceae bacterium]|nr:hypothetical protein [Lachnospiraceae bacterium]